MAQQFNPYGNNYASFSQALRQNLSQQEQENARREQLRIQNEKLAMEKERQAQDMAYRNEQLLQMKMKNNEKLIVPADTGVKPLDVYMTNASRQLVDDAAALKQDLNNGNLTQDEYVAGMTQIQQQVPQLKTFKETFTKNVSEYQDALAAGTLSSAMPPGTDAFYKALADSGGDFNIVKDPESGEITMMGTSADGQPVKIPVSGINQMPKPLVKQPAPWEMLSPSMKAQAVGQNNFDDQAVQDQVNIAFDQMMAQGKGAMMSMAVDWMGMSYEDAEALYMADQDPDAEDRTKLGEDLRQKWMDVARTQFDGARLEIREQELNNALKQKRLEHDTQVSQKMSVAQQKQAAAELAYNNIGKAVGIAEGIEDPSEAAQVLNQSLGGSGLSIEYAPEETSWMPWKDDVPAAFVIYDKKGEVVGEAPNIGDLRQMIANNVLGTDVAMQFNK